MAEYTLHSLFDHHDCPRADRAWPDLHRQYPEDPGLAGGLGKVKNIVLSELLREKIVFSTQDLLKKPWVDEFLISTDFVYWPDDQENPQERWEFLGYTHLERRSRDFELTSKAPEIGVVNIIQEVFTALNLAIIHHLTKTITEGYPDIMFVVRACKPTCELDEQDIVHGAERAIFQIGYDTTNNYTFTITRLQQNWDIAYVVECLLGIHSWKGVK